MPQPLYCSKANYNALRMSDTLLDIGYSVVRKKGLRKMTLSMMKQLAVN